MNRGSRNTLRIKQKVLNVLSLVMLILVSVLLAGCEVHYCEKADAKTQDDHMTLSYETSVEKGKLYDYPATAVSLNEENCKGVYMDDKGFLLEITEDNRVIDAYGRIYVIESFGINNVTLGDRSYAPGEIAWPHYNIPAAIEPDGTLYFGTLIAHRVGTDVTSKIDKNLQNALDGRYLLIEYDDAIWFHTDGTYHVSKINEFNRLGDSEDYEWSISGGTIKLQKSSYDSYRIRRLNEIEYLLSSPSETKLCFSVLDAVYDKETRNIAISEPSSLVLSLVPVEVTTHEMALFKIADDGTLSEYDPVTKSYNSTDSKLTFWIGWTLNYSENRYLPSRGMDIDNEGQTVDSYTADTLLIIEDTQDDNPMYMYYEDSIAGQAWLYRYCRNYIIG